MYFRGPNRPRPETARVKLRHTLPRSIAAGAAALTLLAAPAMAVTQAPPSLVAEGHVLPDQMMAGLSEDERADTWTEIEQALARFETPAGGFVGPCEMLVGAGTR